MRVIYNGVDLMILKTHEFSFESVYDDTGVDYLFTRVTLVVEALVNGQAKVIEGRANGPFMSYDFTGSPTGPSPAPFRLGVDPVPVDPFLSTLVPPGVGTDVGPATRELRRIIKVPNAPVLTHYAIRHRLSVPQSKLYIFSGSGMESGTPAAGTTDPPSETSAELSVESPLTDRRCDCKNGPLPKLLNITEALGDANTFVVVWAVETYINEAGDNNANPWGALLSNRWSQSHTVDEDSFTTVTTEGQATFRTDLLYAAPGESPDAGRATLFMPIPQGFTRVIDYCTGLPDVTGVAYGYTDTQVKSNFVAGPYAHAARIELHHRQAITSNADILQGALSVYERVLSLKVNQNFAKEPERKKKRKKKPPPPPPPSP